MRQALSPGHLPGMILLSLILPGEIWLRRILVGEPLGCGGAEPWKHTQVGAALGGCRGRPMVPGPTEINRELHPVGGRWDCRDT